MADTEKLELLPDWAAKVVKQAIREYRYTGDNLQGTSEEKLILGIRRGDKPLGTITLTHVLLQGRFHVIRMVYESNDRQTTETMRAQSLVQIQQNAPNLMERVCRDGMRIDRRWCADCPHATRHLAGSFRGVTPAATPPSAPGTP